MNKYKVEYIQLFDGEILEGYYYTYADNDKHMEKKIDALWSDKNVISVEYKKV